MDCRPFYVAGFNAHDLVEISLLKPSAFKMESEYPARSGWDDCGGIVLRYFEFAPFECPNLHM